MKKLLYISLLVTFFSYCKKETPPPDDPVDLGYDYYPQAIGKYAIYSVDSIVYDEFTHLPTTHKYRIKEKLTEAFTDAEGKPAIKLTRYIKKYHPSISYDSMAWVLKDVWQVNVTGTSVEVVEENIRFTKLIFPVKEGVVWNGNAKNTLGEWNYTYSYIDKAETIGGFTFNKVLKVQQKDFRTLISYQYYTEKYAAGLGLVYREIKDLHSNTVVAGVPVEDRVEKGTIYKMNLLSYGHEY